MTSRRWLNKDSVGAGLMMLLGGAIVYAGFGYGVGSFEHMGSGFVPVAIGVGLMAIGLLLGIVAMLTSGEGGSSHAQHMNLSGWPDLRGGICILGGVVAFVVLGEHGGLVPATFASVFISALGDRQNSVRDALLMSCALVVLALVIFKWALDVQMPALSWL